MKFNKEISIGNLITIFMIISSVVGGWVSLDKRLTILETKFEYAVKQINKQVANNP